MSFQDPFEQFRRLKKLTDPFQSPAMRSYLIWQEKLKAVATPKPAGVLPQTAFAESNLSGLADALKPHPAIAVMLRSQSLAEEVKRIDSMWEAAYGPLLGTPKLAGLASTLGVVHKTSRLGSAQVLVGLPAAPQIGQVRAALRPHEALARFAQSTAERVLSARPQQTDPYTRSVELAGAQVQVIDETAASLSESSDTQTADRLTPELNLFGVQQDQLVSAPGDGQSVDQLIEGGGPPATGLFSMGAQLARLISAINKDESIREEEPTFSRTADWITATIELPLIVAQDQRSLRDYVNMLYLVIYEGAGSDNLRFLTTNGGELKKEECDALWQLKHVRNKWLFHDPERGSSSDQRSNMKALRKTLVALGQEEGLPQRPEEFERIQLNLVAPLCELMQLLLERKQRPLS